MADITKLAIMRLLRARGEEALFLGADGLWKAALGNRYSYQQTLASSVWTIPHNLNTFPSVAVTDDTGNIVLADVQYIDQNTIRITHSRPVTGAVHCA